MKNKGKRDYINRQILKFRTQMLTVMIIMVALCKYIRMQISIRTFFQGTKGSRKKSLPFATELEGRLFPVVEFIWAPSLNFSFWSI